MIRAHTAGQNLCVTGSQLESVCNLTMTTGVGVFARQNMTYTVFISTEGGLNVNIGHIVYKAMGLEIKELLRDGDLSQV